jgi:cytochrome c oxidase subunit 2
MKFITGDSTVNRQIIHIALIALMAIFSVGQVFAQGDPYKGENLYRVCAACHGENAEGNADTRAPRLAGQFEWYLAQQLRNFRAGLRGTDPDDTNGTVMKPMAVMLADDQAVDDVVAYIMKKNPRRYRYRP